jgi:hypothetical protein
MQNKKLCGSGKLSVDELIGKKKMRKSHVLEVDLDVKDSESEGDERGSSELIESDFSSESEE